MKKYKIINITGVVWYTRDEWQKMKEVAQDAEKLEDSFEEWEKMMKESKKK